jgi:hypothetical protein
VVLGESTTIGENVCHYYVDVDVFECEAFSKGFYHRVM